MMRMNPNGGKVIFFIVFIAAFSLFFCGTALAASEGADRSADLRDLLYRFINFTLLVIILIWALKKADIKSLFSKRIEDIRQKLETLKEDKAEAEEEYQTIDQKLKAFEKEHVAILEQYKKEGEAEKERIIAEANRRVEQMIAQSEATIQQEIQSAKVRLKREKAVSGIQVL